MIEESRTVFYFFDYERSEILLLLNKKKKEWNFTNFLVGIEIDNSFILYGDSPQRVISLLGKPEAVSLKNTNRNIYRRSSENKEEEDFEFDYFYSYFSFGIDILFSAETHRVIKFILHTNFPNCPHFNLYNKCQYRYFSFSFKLYVA